MAVREPTPDYRQREPTLIDAIWKNLKDRRTAALLFLDIKDLLYLSKPFDLSVITSKLLNDKFPIIYKFPNIVLVKSYFTET